MSALRLKADVAHNRHGCPLCANSGHSTTTLFAHIYDDVRCGEQKREARFIELQRSQRQDTKF